MDTFSSLAVDPVEGAAIMNAAGINPMELIDPATHSKVRDIMGFFKGRPDAKYQISKLLTGKPGINAVDHLWGYATLRTSYEKTLKQIDELKEQLYHYEQ